MIKVLTTALVLASTSLAADDDIAGTVNSLLAEQYSNVMNINVLSEMCAIEQYLQVNTESDEFNKKLQQTIDEYVNALGLKNVDKAALSQSVVTRFKAYYQGVRYGGFIAHSFQKSQSGTDGCDKKVSMEVTKSIKELAAQPEFYLED